MNKLMIAIAVIAIISVAAFFLISSGQKPASAPPTTGASAQENAAQDLLQQELDNATAGDSQDIENALVNQ